MGGGEKTLRTEIKRLQLTGATGIQTAYVEISARLLEAMTPEAAGEALLKMNFETGMWRCCPRSIRARPGRSLMHSRRSKVQNT